MPKVLLRKKKKEEPLPPPPKTAAALPRPKEPSAIHSIHSPLLAQAMKNLEPVLDESKKKLSLASDDIVKLEAYFKSNCVVVAFEKDGIAWKRDEHNKFRLFSAASNKPLIEEKVQIRMELYEKLPAFITAFAEELRKRIDDQQI